MGLKSAVILSLLAVQAIAAPHGCTESCSSYHRTYQTQTSNGYQDHAALTQGAINLDDLSFTRPGNWTEHNQFRTDGGLGKVHEERGQYEEGPKRERYYKKNYTYSYSSGNGGAGLSDLHINRDNFGTLPTSQQLIDSQLGINQYGNTQTTAEQHEYNRIHSIHSSSSRRTGQSANLEDFGVSGGNTQHIATGYDNQNVHQTDGSMPANWSRVDTYKTDGGNGRVYEAEGQIVTGPKKVRYFKRNYTSSYTSGGIPVPNSGISTTGSHEIHRELENLQSQLEREIQQATNTAHRVTGGYHGTVGTVGTFPVPVNNGHSVISSVHHEEEEHSSSSVNGPVRQVTYVAPTHERVYSSERRNEYERNGGYIPQPDNRYRNPSPSYTGMYIDSGMSSQNVERQGYDQHRGDMQQAATDIHQSTNTESLIGSDIHRPSLLPSGQAGHYREHWSSASHTKEGTIPGVIIDDSQRRESAEYNRQHQYNEHHSGHSSYQDQSRQNNFNSGYRTTSGRLVTGGLDLGHVGHTADCNEQHADQFQSRYHRNYKRSADYKDGDVQLEQQTTDDVHPDFSQQSQYPKLEDLTQQPMGKLEFGQERDYPYPGNKPKYSNEVDDLTQQTTGQLEFGQHTQQSENFDEFSQQSQHDTQKPSRLSFPSPSKPYSDFSQQHRVPPTTGTLEFGSQNQRHRDPETPSVGDQHLGDLTQQNEDLSQMSSGFDDLARPLTNSQPQRNSQHPYGTQRPTSNGHLEDLTHNTENSHGLSQQSNTDLEFGQHSQHPWQPMPSSQHRHRGQDFTHNYEYGDDDLSQQTGGFDDYSQQTSGKLDFGQQTRYPGQSSEPASSSQHRDDLAQHNQDFTQQTTGKLEFGQPEQYPHETRRPDSDSQTREDLAQQSQDLTQQSMGKLEFGQQKPQRTGSPTATSHPDDDTHQWDDLSQQTSGILEFGQQTQDSTQQFMGNLEFGQQTQDLPQQSMGKLEFGQQKPQHTWSPTGSSHPDDDTHHDDFSQQTSGKLEFGQHTQDLTQQSMGQFEFGHQKPQHTWSPSDSSHHQDGTQQWDDLTQQTSGKLEFGQQTQNADDFWKQASASQHRGDSTPQGQDFTQQTGGFHDLTQQTSDKLEVGQQTQQHFRPWDQLSDLTQKNEDLTQQTTGHLEFGQHDERHSHHRFPYHHRDSTQETQENEDFSQQTGHFAHGPYEQQHRPSTSNMNNHIFESQSNTDMHQQTSQHETGNVFQFNDNNKWNWDKPANLEKPDSSQQTLEFGPQKPVEEPTGVIPLEQQHDNIPQPQPTGLKPAEKPKPRPRYSKPVIISPEVPDEILPSVDHSPSPIHKPEHPTSEDLRADQEIGKDKPGKDSDKQGQQQDGAFDVERGNGDQVNWLHKSNDATVGLQWHYTYHPSDLTNSEPGQSSYYPQTSYNSRNQHRGLTSPKEEQPIPGNTDQQESGDRTIFARPDSQSVYPTENNENTPISVTPQRVEQGVKGHRRPSMFRLPTSTLEPKLEPRILEAYGGGPYDGVRNDDTYSRVTPNPSATLPPINAEDPWYIREKPKESLGTTIIAEIESESTPEVTELEGVTTDIPPPTFWGRLGHKITNTFDKAREKARGIFG